MIKACYDGGLRVFEFTNRGKNALENFPLLKDYIKENCEGMLLGIDSINKPDQTESFINIQTDFIVSPFFDKEIAEICNTNNIYWIPGCATLSEIASAEKIGADIIKIFPGNVLGPGFVKAVRGPMSNLKLMPTGGVSPTKENLNDWFNAGVVCVGIGSKLISKKSLINPEILVKIVKDTMKLIKEIRQK